MSNPLSQVGQTPHPEVPEQVQQQAQQAGAQQQQGGDQGGRRQQGQQQGAPQGPQAAGTTPWEPPATRLPQHPQQQQEDRSKQPAGQQRVRQQGEIHAEDTTLPSPKDAD